MDEIKTVFIVGQPRSGTTWLMWLLAQHPAVVACNHAGFFHELKPLAGWWKMPVLHGKNIHIVNQVDGGAESRQKRKLDEVLGWEEFSSNASRLAEAVFSAIASAKPGASCVVEQTPENLDFWKLILDVCPQAYFLHIVRDPRSVFASLRDAAGTWAPAGEFPTHPVTVGESWRRYLQNAAELRLHTPSFHEVHYENLQANGEAVLQGIFEWLDLEIDEGKCRGYLERGSFNEMKSAQKWMPEGFFRKGKSAGWVDELSPSQIKSLEFVAGDLLDKQGYYRRYAVQQKPPAAVARYHRLRRWKYLIFFELGPRGVRWLERQRIIGRFVRSLRLSVWTYRKA